MQQTIPALQEALTHLKAGRQQQGKAILEKLISSSQPNPQAMHILSRVVRGEGDNKRSRALLEELISIEPDNAVFHYDLGVIELDENRPENAAECMRRANQIQPDNAIVLLHHAAALEMLGQTYEAAVIYQRCWSVALQHGSKLSSLPQSMQQMMMSGRERVYRETRALLEGALDEARETSGQQNSSRLEHLIRILLGEESPSMPAYQRPTGLFFPGLPDRAFMERQDFAWMSRVESQWQQIRDEFLALSRDNQFLNPYIDFDPASPNAEYWKGVNRSLNWASCHIYDKGKLDQNVAERCPVTIEALGQAPLMHVPGHGPETMFSVLEPGTHIPPHHGTVNGRLIVHLPLIVPENCGGLRVAGQTRTWKPGKCLIFDDTYEHEAWNESDETRVVLIYDIWHPDLSELEREAFSRFNQSIAKMNYDVLGPESN